MIDGLLITKFNMTTNIRFRLEQDDKEVIKKLLINAIHEEQDFDTKTHYVSILSKLIK